VPLEAIALRSEELYTQKRPRELKLIPNTKRGLIRIDPEAKDIRSRLEAFIRSKRRISDLERVRSLKQAYKVQSKTEIPKKIYHVAT